MSNRLNAPNQFETLSPPWLLSQLDTNFTQNQAAWNDSSLGFVNGICTDTGAANTYVITAGNLPFGAPSSYNPGMTVFFVPVNSNTTSSTITIGALGSAAILNKAGLALQGGEIPASKLVGLVYSNTAPVGFRILTSNCLAFSATNPANTVLNCSGYDAVSALMFFTGSAGASLTLNNLAIGTSVCIAYNNTSAAARSIPVSATDPSGANFANVVVTGSLTVAGGIFSGNSSTLQAGATINNFSIAVNTAIAWSGVVTGAIGSQNLFLAGA